MLEDLLARTGSCAVTVTDAPAAFAKLRGFDAVIIHTQGGTLTRAQEQALCRFVARGGGLVAVHGAAEAFKTSKEYRALLGSRVASRCPATEIAVAVAPGPVGARIDDFTIVDEVLLLKRAPADATVHATGVWQGSTQPLAYTRSHGKGRVFYTALGRDPRAFGHPAFQRLLWRGLRFVTGGIAEKTIRSVVIGYGATYESGRTHAEAMRRIEGYELLGVCDTDAARREAAQEDLGDIRTYASVAAVTKDREVDLGVVATPHHTHARTALELIRARKHVLCENPLGLTVKECDQAIRTARQKKVMLAAFHDRRGDGDYRTIQRIVAGGRIGDVFHVELGTGTFGHPGHGWRSDRKRAGGLLHDWGSHLVDWALTLIPGPVTQVIGFSQKQVWHDVTIPDWSSVVLRFEGNRSAMLELGHITGVARPKWRILGSRGSIWGDWGLEHLTVVTYEGGRLVSEKVPVDETRWEGCHADVADHLLTGTQLTVNPETGRRVVAVVEAAEKSARTGREQSVSI
jgi:scyllo-inositol 2-dehydrogenase (NADP+)